MAHDAVEITGGYDLHTHSVISDGTTSPSEIAAEAAQLGLEGFALTDHDTIAGWDEAREAAHHLGVEFLPGIEITTTHNHSSRHLLGYGIDRGFGELFAALDTVRDSRDSRARRMVDLLSKDFSISWEQVMADAATVSVGRPHIADALVQAGYFADRGAAFNEILHPRSPYYVPTFALDTKDAIRLVRAAGGLPVLAHPAAQRQRAAVPVSTLQELTQAGLWGIELDHPENREDWLPKLREAATELGLEVTGSSDYHGVGKPNRLGERRTDAALVRRMRELVATPR